MIQLVSYFEFAEDDIIVGWEDLQSYNINQDDVVLGLAASGTTPYVIGALDICQKKDIKTACVVCNTNSLLSKVADFPIEVVVGPEFVRTRYRADLGAN